MAGRLKISPSVDVPLLVSNLHTCCVCRVPNLPIEIHHIDGNPGNNDPENLAVVCRNCHSRVTGDEGLGRRYSPAEVTEFKKRWESACNEITRSNAELAQLQNHLDAANAGLPFKRQDLAALYVNRDLAQAEGKTVGVEITGPLGPFMVDRLTNALERAGKLSRVRPKTVEEAESGQLIYETVVATKVLFPHPVLQSTVPSIRELAVWVADPSNEAMAQRTDDEYDFSASFLYLLTPLYSNNEFSSFYSGCSALQVISNLIAGQPFLTRDWSEPLGRNNYLHPIEKLKTIGGIAIDHRWIDVLYKPRYMTDEQCFVDADRTHRVHDLLAYPLYLGNSIEKLAKRVAQKEDA